MLELTNVNTLIPLALTRDEALEQLGVK
jgi:hypothetical protein